MIRTKIMTYFKFHSVGQGLFYSGKIQNFNFIFDIGSLNKAYLKREIDSYVTNVLKNNSDVDYVFLSHLDKDHISGLIYLMTKLNKTKNKIKCVVLPYIPNFNELYLLLKGKGVTVHPISDNFSAEDSLSQLNKKFRNKWKFSVFYIKPTNVSTNSIHRLKINATNPNGLFKQILTKSIYKDLRLSPLWNAADLDLIKDVFDKITGLQNRNTASLNLVHGLVVQKTLITKATILTGDSDWRTNGNNYVKWLKSQMITLNNVQVLQIPHHGSINNWDISQNWAKNHGFSKIVAVFTTGNYKAWNHPDIKVIKSLLTCTKNFEVVDASHNYDYII